MKKLDLVDIDEEFDTLSGTSTVYQVFPNIFKDDRGWFMERLQFPGNNFMDIKQMNRSCSRPGVIRGCHAQKGPYCQAKLVEAINTDLIDVITDARPTSKTFGKSKMYLLSYMSQNMLYVPHGFLHAFIVPHSAQTMAYFNYYCDNKYDKDSEVCVNPADVIQPLIDEIDWNDIVQAATFGVLNNTRDLSFNHKTGWDIGHKLEVESEFTIAKRDLSGLPLDVFLAGAMQEYKDFGKNWYD